MKRTTLALGLALFALALVPARARAAGEFKAHGFLLPGGSVRVDEDRFRLPAAWEDSVKFYKTALPPAQYPRRALHSQAGVRAVHIDNPRPADEEWEGANLYENKGEVRVYVLTRKAPEADRGGAPKKPGGKG